MKHIYKFLIALVCGAVACCAVSCGDDDGGDLVAGGTTLPLTKPNLQADGGVYIQQPLKDGCTVLAFNYGQMMVYEYRNNGLIEHDLYCLDIDGSTIEAEEEKAGAMYYFDAELVGKTTEGVELVYLRLKGKGLPPHVSKGTYLRGDIFDIDF